MSDGPKEFPATLLVAREINAEMARQRRTVTWLAAELGMDRMSLSRRLNARQSMTLEDVRRIADILTVPVSQLTAPLDNE